MRTWSLDELACRQYRDFADNRITLHTCLQGDIGQNAGRAAGADFGGCRADRGGVDAPTLNGLYSQLKILKHSDNHGGAGRGQGRKPKSKDEAEEVSAQLDAVVNSPALLIASIREPLATVYKSWRERDVFARIDLKDLGQVAATLNELASAANDALKARSK